MGRHVLGSQKTMGHAAVDGLGNGPHSSIIPSPAAGIGVLDGAKTLLDDARLKDDQREWGTFLLEVTVHVEHLSHGPSCLSQPL